MKTHLHNIMKKLFVLGILIIMAMIYPQHTYAQQQSVGINNASPDPSAAIDAQSGIGISQGILFPRVNLTTPAFAFPSPGPATHLLLINTSSTFGKGIGLYRNSGTASTPVWKKLLEDGEAWSIFGNTGITQPSAPGTYGTSTIVGNFFGNTDNKDIVIGINGIEQARFFKSGQFNIGSANVGAKFEVHQTSSISVVRFYNYGNALDIDLRRPSGTQSSPTQTGATSIVGRINGQGYDGATFRDIGNIRFITTSATTSTSSPGKIIFATTKTGSITPTDAVIIDESGNVGINKIPVYKLDVENGTDRSYFHAGTAGSTESYVTLARSNWEGVNAYAYNDDGVEGTSEGALYYGIYGKNTNAAGDAIWGQNIATSGTGVGAGVVGVTAQSGIGSAGVWGQNSNTSGTGTVGTGQNQPASILVNGSGGSFTGNTTGAYIKSNATGNYALQVNGTGNGTYTTTATPASYWGLVVGAGSALASGQIWSTSDARFKKNIHTVPNGVLGKIMSLNPCNYTYDIEKYPMFKGETREQSGFIAQELEQIFPDLVTNQKYIPDPTFDPTKKSNTEIKSDNSKKKVNANKDLEIPQVQGYYAVDYVSLIPYLVKAIQEQQEIIEVLKTEIENLKNK